MATSVHQGRKAISTTDTAVALASAQEVNWLIVWAPASNKQILKIGSSTVTDTGAATDGVGIVPGAIPLPVPGAADLGDIYINGTAGDEIYYFAGSTD
jgi:hypothetical protein